MNKTVIRSSEGIYNFLLKFYPLQYRQEFGEEMKYVFSESLKDAYVEKGEQGVLYLWTKTVIDAGKSLITQHIENGKGGVFMKAKNNDIIMQNKIFLWGAIATGLVLMIPLIANFPWTLFDYLVMGVLLYGLGSIFVLAARKFSDNRLVVGIIVAGLFMLIWAELAVGVFGTLFAGS